MTRTLTAAFVPLTDAAPLILARALGYAEEEGLKLRLIRAASWAMARDMLDIGQVDAAHMLSVVPVAQRLGLTGPARFEVPMVLTLGGAVIGLAPALAARLRAQGFAPDFRDVHAAAHALAAACPEPRIGVPFAFSLHAELVRLWLADCGALPRLLTVPPPMMAEALAMGEIDGFCVGEPWGSHAVDAAGALLLLPGRTLLPGMADKVLATRSDWTARHPQQAGALVRALSRAADWLARPANAATAAEILAQDRHLSMPADRIERALTGRMLLSQTGPEITTDPLIRFARAAEARPNPAQERWIACRLAARLTLPDTSPPTQRPVFRPELFDSHIGMAPASSAVAG